VRHACFALALAACSGASAPADLAVGDDLALRAGDLGTGAACTFNRECVAADRCACDVKTGCFCELGARGSGENGVTPCTSSNDCKSSLCVEGMGGISYCSDECESAAQCGAMLPRCLEVTLIGRICTRAP
jgi:hypothetical protein